MSPTATINRPTPRPSSTNPAGPGGPSGPDDWRGQGRPLRTPRRPDPRRRIRIAGAIALSVLGVMTVRLVSIQLLDTRSLAAQSATSRVREVDLPSTRGDIVDRDGSVLATTQPRFTVVVDPSQMVDAKRNRDDRDAVAARLSAVLGLSYSPLRASMDPKRKYVPVVNRVPAADVVALDAAILEDQAKRPDRGPLARGVTIEKHDERIYPNGVLASNVVGLVGEVAKPATTSTTSGSATPSPSASTSTTADATTPVVAGVVGIEKSFDTLLAGVPGSETFQVASNGTMLPGTQHVVREAEQGRTVRLAIDSRIQWVAQRAIAEQVAAVKAESGTAVVMDPRTGEVLALASVPTFDPADRSAVPERTLAKNRAVADVFEPGSTSKVISVASALDTGVVAPDARVVVPGRLTRYDKTFRDAEDHDGRRYTLAGVLAHSSNIGTILVSDGVGKTRLEQYMRGFGLGSRTNIGLPGEVQGILPPSKDWSGTQRYTVAYGLGVAVTAVQMASVFATVANDGVRVSPTLVKDVLRPDGTVETPTVPERRRVISQSTAESMQRLMEAVVSDEGTGSRAAVPGYRIAGKTGTADRVNPACGCYRGGGTTASFGGFAPADDPQLVVLVVVQGPKGPISGGKVAAPVFSRIMQYALGARGVPPTTTVAPVQPLTW